MSVRAERPLRASARPAPNRYRDDIQGLRAVASLLVASFHIWFGTVSGGVDLFFVLGGFLLATTLVGELERRGSIRVWQYVKRTATRLFPMAGLVLLVVSAVLLFTEPPLSFQRNVTDVFAAATYWENWRLAGDATDYIAAGHDKSAVQHFWAMSVQGQSTLLLLVFVVLLGLLAKRATWPVRRVAVVGFAVLTIASFISALNGVAVDPVPTYYSTWARLWEFGIGAMAALLVTRIHLPTRVRAVLGSLGLALVLTAGLLPSSWPYPGLIALYPVGGALLVLLAGASGDPVGGNRLLTWKPLVWLGGFSYGLYLWSWPILKLYVELFPDRAEPVSFFDGVILLAVSIAVAWAASKGLKLLGRVRNPISQVDASAPKWKSNPRLLTSVTVPLVALVTFVGVQVAPQVHEDAIQAIELAPAVASIDDLAAVVADAVADPTVPDGELISGAEARSEEWELDDCVSVASDEALDRCAYGESDADREVWLVGDSQAVTWAPGFREALGEGTKLQLMGLSMCPFTSGAGLDSIDHYRETCEGHNEWVVDLATERLPELVVISYGAWWVGDGYEHLGDDVGADLGRGSSEYVRALTDLGITVVWLDSVPPTRDLDECMEASTVAEASRYCETPFGAERQQRVDELAGTMSDAGAQVVPTTSWFCDLEAAACPNVVAGMPVHSDPTHIGRQYSLYLSNVIADAVLAPQGF
ncbi:acyltransferase family protein [Pseudoclavibacter helvolus]|uniref:acyltransferase family protein n=1 Tax=Pseudoclavibacter helvolus TaxID=255205 RepID=UPI003C75294C